MSARVHRVGAGRASQDSPMSTSTDPNNRDQVRQHVERRMAKIQGR